MATLNGSARPSPPNRVHADLQVLRAEAARFGVKRFRPGQREIIEAVLDGRNVLGIMPTGAGKSLCYQLPAMLLPHPVVVVSPLIALMQDQQEKMAAADVDAAKLNSTLSSSEERETLEGIQEGQHSLVYVTPERFENREALELLKQSGVSLLVVDEAHCVSQWGHDFRPSYLSIRNAIRELGHPPVMALTATATPKVEEDILKQLAIQDALVINTGIERPNLGFEVVRTVNSEAKRQRVLELADSEGSCIVYCATIRLVADVEAFLREHGVDTVRYHGELKTREREEAQERFMRNQARVMVATKAFGMGIDKPDIRTVIHYNFPDSLESYYQEAGRAGRDGKPARAVLLYRLEDRRIQSYFLRGKYPNRELSAKVYDTIREISASGRQVTLKDLITISGLPKRRVQVVTALLESSGIVQRGKRGIRMLREFATSAEFESFLAEYENRHSTDRERISTIMRYAETAECRVRFLHRYFGEAEEEDCGQCDNCRARERGDLDVSTAREETGILAPSGESIPADSPALAAAQAESPTFTEGQRVRHKAFGMGEIRQINGDKILVEFPKRKKTVSVRPEYLKAA